MSSSSSGPPKRGGGAHASSPAPASASASSSSGGGGGGAPLPRLRPPAVDKLIENARAETRQPLVQLRRSNSCAQMRAVFRSLPPATVQKEAANAVVIENGASRYAVTEADFDRLLLRGNSAGVMLVESALAEAAAVFGWNLENGVLPFKRVVVLGGGSSFPAVQRYFVQRFSIPVNRIHCIDLLPVHQLLPKLYPPGSPAARAVIVADSEDMEAVVAKVKEAEGEAAAEDNNTLYIMENSTPRRKGYDARAGSLAGVLGAGDVVLHTQWDEPITRHDPQRQQFAFQAAGLVCVGGGQKAHLLGKAHWPAIFVPSSSSFDAEAVQLQQPPAPAPVDPSHHAWAGIYLLALRNKDGVIETYSGSFGKKDGTVDDGAQARLMEHLGYIATYGGHHAREVYVEIQRRIKARELVLQEARDLRGWQSVQAVESPECEPSERLSCFLGGIQGLFHVVRVLKRRPDQDVDEFAYAMYEAEQEVMDAVLQQEGASRSTLFNTSSKSGYMDLACKALGGTSSTLARGLRRAQEATGVAHANLHFSGALKRAAIAWAGGMQGGVSDNARLTATLAALQGLTPGELLDAEQNNPGFFPADLLEALRGFSTNAFHSYYRQAALATGLSVMELQMAGVEKGHDINDLVRRKQHFVTLARQRLSANQGKAAEAMRQLEATSARYTDYWSQLCGEKGQNRGAANYKGKGHNYVERLDVIPTPEFPDLFRATVAYLSCAPEDGERLLRAVMERFRGMKNLRSSTSTKGAMRDLPSMSGRDIAVILQPWKGPSTSDSLGQLLGRTNLCSRVFHALIRCSDGQPRHLLVRDTQGALTKLTKGGKYLGFAPEVLTYNDFLAIPGAFPIPELEANTGVLFTSIDDFYRLRSSEAHAPTKAVVSKGKGKQKGKARKDDKKGASFFKAPAASATSSAAASTESDSDATAAAAMALASPAASSSASASAASDNSTGNDDSDDSGSEVEDEETDDDEEMLLEEMDPSAQASMLAHWEKKAAAAAAAAGGGNEMEESASSNSTASMASSSSSPRAPSRAPSCVSSRASSYSLSDSIASVPAAAPVEHDEEEDEEEDGGEGPPAAAAAGVNGAEEAKSASVPPRKRIVLDSDDEEYSG